jgi:hyperosmotically inducible periplasmic protein
VEQIMQSLERITAWMAALARTLRASPLFAALEPVPVRERLRIPRRAPGGWERSPGFAEPTGRGVGRSRRAPASTWRAMVLVLAALAALSAVNDARAGDGARLSRDVDNIGDARRQTQIATVYAISPLLRDSVLIVTVTGANASLVGKAGSMVEKDLAEQIALSVDGIEHVDNMIGITDMPTLRAGGDISFGQKVDDVTTTAAIRSKLLWGATTNGLAIQVVTVRGKVRLDGTVYDSAQRDLIARVAADTAGALSVTNGIVVFSVPPVTSGARADAQKLVDEGHLPVSDAWITARIQSTFLLSPSINRSAISVATSEGSVSLSGLAGSPSARVSAIALAKNTRGVQSVDSTRLAVD